MATGGEQESAPLNAEEQTVFLSVNGAKELCDGFGHDHMYRNGTFFNPWSEEAKGLGGNFTGKDARKLLKFAVTPREKDEILGKSKSASVLDEHYPVEYLDQEKLNFIQKPPEEGMRLIWLGHASCLVQFDGVTVLTDPSLNLRASPSQWVGPRRYRNIPCPIEDLPPIDIVVISHNHYDHLDYETVLKLNKSQGEQLTWFGGLGLKKWLKDSKCTNVHEMDWWQKIPMKGVEVIFTPTQHWSKRTATDTNKSLWGSWVVKGPKHSFYHAGDTGYCQTFKAIGEEYGPFDLAAIPIGAYHPRSFLRPQHVNPTEAVQIHQDIKSKKSFAIHWGTFDLGREAFLDPPRKLNEARIQKNISSDKFFDSNIGKIINI